MTTSQEEAGKWWNDALNDFYVINKVEDPVDRVRVECLARYLVKSNPVYANATVVEVLQAANVIREVIYR